MATTSEQPPVHAHEPASSGDTDEDVSSLDPAPRPLVSRQSSIRFSQGTKTSSESPMSNRRSLSSSDEITPIRRADGHSERRYNTNTETEATGSQRDTHGSTPNTVQKPTASKAKDPEENLPWYKRVAEKYGAVSLENKGSVARDHLALERTFLAWLRTSLAFASIGIAITQLFRLNTAVASPSKRYSSLTKEAAFQTLPYSPLVGHSIPEELIQYLQWQSQQPTSPPIKLGPTLLDQLLLLPAPNSDGVHPQPYLPSDFTTSAFDEDAAAKLRHVGKPLGATFLAISIVILLVGFHRYFQSQYWIIRGKFPASRGSVALVGFIAGALIVASLVVVLVIAPASFEKK